MPNAIQRPFRFLPIKITPNPGQIDGFSLVFMCRIGVGVLITDKVTHLVVSYGHDDKWLPTAGGQAMRLLVWLS